MVRTCSTCGAPARPDDRFCAACGAGVNGGRGGSINRGRFCTRCGSPLSAGARFCGTCGAAMRVGDDDQTEAADVLADDRDPLVDWDRDHDLGGLTPDRAPTESIVLPTSPRGGDTAVLPEPEPYLSPRGASPETRPEPRPQPRPEPEPEAPEPRPRRGFPWGASLALLGALAVLASSLLEWDPSEVAVLGGAVPRDIALRALLDPETRAGPSLGLALLGLGTAGALVALLTMLVPALRFLRRLLGLVTLALPVGFALRVLDPLLAQGETSDLPRLLGAGVYTAAAGAFVQIVAGRWFRR